MILKCNDCDEEKDLFKCDGCNNYLCRNCGNIRPSEVKVLAMKERVLKFYCKLCISCNSFTLLQNTIQDKNNEIESKNKIIELLEENIRVLKQKVNNKEVIPPLYSKVLKRNDEEVLVIKPIKDIEQKSTITRQALQEKVDPGSLGVGISNIKHVRNGGVAICCNNEQPVENIRRNIEQKLGNDYEVKKIEKKNPKIKILRVNKKDVEDTKRLVEKIIIQNTINTEPDKLKIKVIHKHETKDERHINVLLEVDPVTYSFIRKKETLSIGWKSCKYIDYINIIQCFKCWKFGHMSNNCRSINEICSSCAAEHKSCEAENKICTNCKYAAEVLKIPNVKFNHSARDKTNCAAYNRIYKQMQANVDYPQSCEQGGAFL